MSRLARSATAAVLQKNSASFVRGLVLWTGVSAFALGSIVGLYLAKSAMGINLFASRSPLHELLFHFVK